MACVSIADFRTKGILIFNTIDRMRTCDVCGNSFQPNTAWHLRCSRKCSSIANNARKRSDANVKMCRTCRVDLPMAKYLPAHRSCIDCEEIYASGKKRCRTCKQVKPHGEFHRRPNRNDGLSSYCKPCVSEQSKVRNALPHKKQKARENKYRVKYGIGVAEYDRMLQAQGGCCAICRVPAEGSPLHVDHDHVTGRVRELLCLKCNALLGQAGDQISILRLAIQYLERNSS